MTAASGQTVSIDTTLGTISINGIPTFISTVTQAQSGATAVRVFDFASINIPAGVTIIVTGTDPLALLSRGNTTIVPSITASGGSGSSILGIGTPGLGSLGGGDGGAGGLIAGLAATSGTSTFGSDDGQSVLHPNALLGGQDGGGGGNGGQGGSGGAVGGAPAGTPPSTELYGGGGGGGGPLASITGQGIGLGGGGGGAGGGGIEITATGTLTVGSVTSNGGNGGGSTTLIGGVQYGGGGAGGSIVLSGSSLVLTGAITANGGGVVSGSGAGGGGGGQVFLAGLPSWVLGSTTLGNLGANVSVLYGADGTANGTEGLIWMQTSGLTAPTGQTAIFNGTTFTNAATTMVTSSTLTAPGMNISVGSNLVLDGGSLQFTGTGETFGPTAALALTANNGTIDTQTFTDTVSTAITGGALTKVGTGTLLLSGANTYTGGTTISAGTIQAGSATALGAATGSLSLTGGNLDLHGNSLTVGTLSGNAGTMITDSTTGLQTVTFGATSNATYAGVVQDGAGAVGLVKQGTGTETLSGANTYGGGTTILGGAIKLGSSTALGSNAGSLIITNGSVDLNGNSVTVGNFSGGATGTLTTTLVQDPTFTFGSSMDETYAGTITDGQGTMAVVKQGTGTETLSGLNTYTGGTTIEAGAIKIAGASALGAATGNLMLAGGDLDLDGESITVGDLIGSAGSAITNTANGASDLTFGKTNDETYAGTIQDGTGTVGLVKQGTGTETLSGNNTYSGGTTINAGAIKTASSTALGAATSNLMLAGGDLDLDGEGLTVGDLSGSAGSTITNTANTASAFTFGKTNDETYAGTITEGTGTVGLIKQGTGTETLFGNNTYSGGTTINAGAIKTGSATALGASTGSLTINNGTLDLDGNSVTVGNFSGSGTGTITTTSAAPSFFTFGATPDETYAGLIQDGAGTVGVVKQGTGTETFSGANTYSGGTQIKAGVLNATNNAALGTGAVTVDSGASLEASGGITMPNALAIEGTGAHGAGAIFSSDGAANTFRGPLAFNGDATIANSANTGALAFSGNLSLGANTVTLIGPGQIDFSGSIGGTGGVTVASGTTVMSGAAPNSYTGLTNVLAGATLDLDKTSGEVSVPGNLDIAGTVNDEASGQLASTSVVTMLGSGAWNFTSPNVTESIAGLVGASANSVITGSGNNDTIVLDGPGIYSYAGEINGTLSLVKQGTGTQALLGANGYSGGTTLASGTLVVGNPMALGTGNVTQTGGVLATNGINHVIDIGGNFDQTGGTLDLAINGPPGAASNDHLVVTGTATLDGNLALTVSPGAVAPGRTGSYVFVTAGGGITQVGAGWGQQTIPVGGVILTITPVTTGGGNGGVGTGLGATVTVTQLPLSTLHGASFNPNQLSLAQYFDRFDRGTVPSSFLLLLENLDAISPDSSAFAGALNQLTPLKFATVSSLSVFNGTEFLGQLMENHLAQHRTSSGIFSMGGTPIDDTGLVINSSDDDPGLQMVHSRLLAWNPPVGAGLLSDSSGVLGGVDTNDLDGPMATPASAESARQWDMFVTGNAVFGQEFSDNTTGLPHADSTTASVQLGAEYKLSPEFVVGALFNYGHTDATLDPLGSNTQIDTYMPGVFAGFSKGGWYANALAAYGFSGYDQERKVSIANFGGTAKSHPNGDQFVGDFNGGYDFRGGNWTLGPVAGLQYVHLDVDSYSETGLPGADLDVDSDKADSLRSRIGGRVSYAVKDENLVFTPHAEATWQHEYMDQSRGITAQFDGVGAGSFVTRTENPSRDSGLFELGLDAQVNQSIMVFGNYDVQAGQQNYFGQSIQAGIKIGF